VSPGIISDKNAERTLVVSTDISAAVHIATPSEEKPPTAPSAPVKTKSEELAEKLKVLAKRLDHFERAKREEELPLLQKKFDEQRLRDREFYKEQVAQFLIAHKAAHAEKLLEKQRFAKMYKDHEAFETKILERRNKEFLKWKEERDEKKRELEMEKKRREDEELEKKRKAEDEQREEERRREEEEKRKEEEEQRRTEE